MWQPITIGKMKNKKFRRDYHLSVDATHDFYNNKKYKYVHSKYAQC